MKRSALVLWLSVLVLGHCGSKAAPRPEHWAQPVSSAVLKNWYRLDGDVYRSEQPTREGFEEIKAKGIKSIINLRDRHSDVQLVEGLGFHLVEIPMTPFGFSEADVMKVLEAIQSSPKPLLFHCQVGADRSGLIGAMYRIVFQVWSKEDALAEMRKGGFGFHRRYFNIPAFIRRADVTKIRARLNLSR